MTTPQPDPVVRAAAAARRARLTPAQITALCSLAASLALDGHLLTDAELAAGAELLAGRIDFAEYRRRLHV